MPQPKRRVRIWAYLEASRTVPYVRLILGKLRESYIAAWHQFRLGHHEEMRRHSDEGVVDLEELDKIGVLPYERAIRGIALFPLFVHVGGSRRHAYFVYKDSRDTIDTYIFNDDFCEHNDLLGYERPVPEAWKQAGAVPRLEEVRP